MRMKKNLRFGVLAALLALSLCVTVCAGYPRKA